MRQTAKQIGMLSLLLACVCVFCGAAIWSAEAASVEESRPEAGNLEGAAAWVGELQAAQETDQLILVSGTGGSRAWLGLYEKGEDGGWTERLRTSAYIGKNGFGKEKAGDNRTPRGVFHFTLAFGIAANPGCSMPYIQVDRDDYWCGDGKSPFYNRFVSLDGLEKGVTFSRSASEHLIDYTQAYQYCLNISYNEDGTPGLGSAIFLHCTTKNAYTAGCVAIPRAEMIRVLQMVREGCRIVMDESANLRGEAYLAVTAETVTEEETETARPSAEVPYLVEPSAEAAYPVEPSAEVPETRYSTLTFLETI